MAITTQTINDNSYIIDLVIIGGAASDSYTINVSDLESAIQIDGVYKQRLNIELEYSLDPSCSLKVEFATDSSGSFSSAEYWRGYGTGKVYLKNTQENSNGDIRLTFVGGPGCCKVFAYKKEGFKFASPYYRQVGGRRA